MSDSIRGQEAFDKHQEIVSNEKTRRELMAKNARLLNEMHESHLYQDFLGDNEAEWAGYLAEVEVYYTRSKVHALTTAYKRLTEKLGIHEDIWSQVPLTRIIDMLPIVTAENYPDWFAKGLTLTTRDWNIEIRQAKKLPTEEDEHEHDMVEYKICKKCGRKEKHHHDTETAPK